MTDIDWTGGHNDSPSSAQLRSAVRAFAETAVLEPARRYDAAGEFHADIYDALRKSPFPAACFPPELGGTDGSTKALIVVLEELGRADISTAVTFATTVELAAGAVLLGGTPEQRATWIPPVIAGEQIASYAIAEQSSGSDVKALETVARRVGASWVLDGSKKYVTNVIPHLPGYVVIVAKLESAGRDAPLGAFVVPYNTPGLEVSAPHDKMSWRGTVLVDLVLRDCELPEDAYLGGGAVPWTSGVSRVFELGRTGMAAIALGSSERLLQESLDHAADRVQFGKSLDSFQSTRMRLAEMCTDIAAARLLVYRAAELRDELLMGRYGFEHGIDTPAQRTYSSLAHVAKLFTSEVTGRVADAAVQILGGKGLTEESDVGRFYRDQRMFRIGQGTTEIEKLIIARALLGSRVETAAQS